MKPKLSYYYANKCYQLVKHRAKKRTTIDRMILTAICHIISTSGLFYPRDLSMAEIPETVVMRHTENNLKDSIKFLKKSYSLDDINKLVI